MVYECEECETALAPSLMACPRCGQRFDDPVPADASVPDDPADASIPDERFDDAPLPISPPLFQLPPASRRRPPARFPRVAARLLGIFALIGLGWLGVRDFAIRVPPAPVPVAPALPAPLTEVRAHPAYAADMAAFVEKLRASGVAAQWPAFGGSDTLLITPPAIVGGQQAAWNADLYKQLAQGIYGSFWEKRYETGFSDSDSTTCFVLVCDASGRIVAADLMGNVV